MKEPMLLRVFMLINQIRLKIALFVAFDISQIKDLSFIHLSAMVVMIDVSMISFGISNIAILYIHGVD